MCGGSERWCFQRPFRTAEPTVADGTVSVRPRGIERRAGAAVRRACQPNHRTARGESDRSANKPEIIFTVTRILILLRLAIVQILRMTRFREEVPPFGDESRILYSRRETKDRY